MIQRKYLLFLLLLLSIKLIGQDVKKMKEKTRLGTAKFYVLKSDRTTKHGEYKIKAHIGKTILVSGNYSNGKKNGDWVERYTFERRNLKQVGKYKEDKKIGEWSYYDIKGNIVQIYDHSKELVIKSIECGGKEEYEYYLSGEIKEGILDCPPTIIGGKALFIHELVFTSIYKISIKKSINTMISFFILENGEIESIQFSNPVGNDLKKFIESKIVERKGEWISASIDGKNVKAKFILPFILRINETR